MNDWPFKRLDPEQELRAADALLHKADALLRRHRPTDAPPALPGVAPGEAELPILTEVVSDFGPAAPLLSDALPDTFSPPPSPAPAAAPPASPQEAAQAAAARTDLAEHLVELDTAIQREVEAWFATEMPQFLAHEFEKLAERLRAEALIHLRATLLPALSERISESLGKPSRPER